MTGVRPRADFWAITIESAKEAIRAYFAPLELLLERWMMQAPPESQAEKLAWLIGRGRFQEALPIARGVAAALDVHPDFGPSHPDTLTSQHIVAFLLDREGHTNEALSIARAVAAARGAHPDYGPSHPDTLTSQHLVASLLGKKDQFEEALVIAGIVAAARESHPALGPSHTDTLTSRVLLAYLLDKNARAEGRWRIKHADGTVEDDLIPESQAELLARLISQGRFGEALPIARSVAQALDSHPDFGPAHPDTLLAQKLVKYLVRREASGEDDEEDYVGSLASDAARVASAVVKRVS
jgi:hypothetical protein